MQSTLLERDLDSIPSVSGPYNTTDPNQVLDHALAVFVDQAKTERSETLQRLSITLNVDNWNQANASDFPEVEDIIYYYPEYQGATLFNGFFDSNEIWGDRASGFDSTASELALYPILPVAYTHATSYNSNLGCTVYRLGDDMISSFFDHIELWTVHCKVNETGEEIRGNIYMLLRSNIFGLLGSLVFIIALLGRMISLFSYWSLLFHTHRKSHIILRVGPVQYLGNNSFLNVLDLWSSFDIASRFFAFDRLFFMEQAPWTYRFTAVMVVSKVFLSAVMFVDGIIYGMIRFISVFILKKKSYDTNPPVVSFQLGPLLRPELFLAGILFVSTLVVERMSELTLMSGAFITHQDIMSIPVLNTSGLCRTEHSRIVLMVCFFGVLIRSVLIGIAVMYHVVIKKAFTSQDIKTNSFLTATGPAVIITYDKCLIPTKTTKILSYEASWSVGYFRISSTLGSYCSRVNGKYYEVTTAGRVVTEAVEKQKPSFVDQFKSQFNHHVGMVE